MIVNDNEMLKAFQTYDKANFKITPVLALDKRPALKNFLKTSSSNFEANRKLFLPKYRGYNVGLCLAPSGLVAVDVDLKNEGMEKWQELTAIHGEPETLSATTGSGGRHYVFQAKPGVSYRGKIDNGIDIRHNHIIVVEPSIHYHKKTQYRWDKDPSLQMPMPYPDWLTDLIEKPTQLNNRVHAPTSYRSLEVLVDIIQDFEFDYDEWIRLGMAFKSELPNDQGLSLFLRATQNQSYAEGDYELAKAKWESFNDNAGPQVRLGTVLYMLEEKGADLQPFYSEKTTERFDKMPRQFDLSLIPNSKMENGQIICTSAADLVEGINRHGYFYLSDVPGSPFGKLTTNLKTNEPELILLPESRLKVDLAPLKLKQEVATSTGTKVTLKGADQVWTTSSFRKTYTKIAFSPVFRPGEINLWSEIFLEPIAGDCSQLIDMIHESICGGKDNHSNFLLKYFAHMIQKPAERVYTVPILYSAYQGTGKGLLCEQLMSRILGQKHVKTNDVDALTTRFNVHLAYRLLTFIDEVSFKEAALAASKVKSLVGSETMSVEYKGGARITVDNYSRYVMATNSDAAWPIEKGNRRFAVIEGSKKYANKRDYFAPILNGIRNGKLSNFFLDYLTNLDISNFDPNELPNQTGISVNYRLKSLGEVGEFWHFIFLQSPKPVFAQGRGLCTDEAYEQYVQFTIGRNRQNQTGFWAATRNILSCLENLSATQHRDTGGRGKFRAYAVTPRQCLDSICKALEMEPPDGFNEADFYDDRRPVPRSETVGRVLTAGDF